MHRRATNFNWLFYGRLDIYAHHIKTHSQNCRIGFNCSCTRDGILSTASQYSDEPDIITRALIEDGRNNLTLDKTIPVSGPVRILQGMKDEDVPWQHAMRAVPQFISDDVEVTLIKDGDHRLSSENDLTRLEKTLTEITAKIGSSRI